MANKPYVVVEWNDTETDAKDGCVRTTSLDIIVAVEQECIRQ